MPSSVMSFHRSAMGVATAHASRAAEEPRHSAFESVRRRLQRQHQRERELGVRESASRRLQTELQRYMHAETQLGAVLDNTSHSDRGPLQKAQKRAQDDLLVLDRVAERYASGTFGAPNPELQDTVALLRAAVALRAPELQQPMVPRMPPAQESDHSILQQTQAFLSRVRSFDARLQHWLDDLSARWQAYLQAEDALLYGPATLRAGKLDDAIMAIAAALGQLDAMPDFVKQNPLTVELPGAQDRTDVTQPSHALPDWLAAARTELALRCDELRAERKLWPEPEC